MYEDTEDLSLLTIDLKFTFIKLLFFKIDLSAIYDLKNFSKLIFFIIIYYH